MESLLAYQFIQNALWAALLSAVVCGIVGSYIVVRRIVFVSGGITHASFGGLGLGVYLGYPPLLTAGIVAVLAAIGISKLGRSGLVREDSAIASIWALGMALGVLFMSLTPGYTAGLSSFLFGNILLVTTTDLWVMAGFALLLVGLFSYYYRTILYLSFDADFARSRGVRVDLWSMVLLGIVSVAMVLSIRIVGIMLLMSLLTLPQSIVGLFTSSFRTLIIGSVGVSLVASVVGLWLSYSIFTTVSPGVLIVLFLFLLFGLARLLTLLLRLGH